MCYNASFQLQLFVIIDDFVTFDIRNPQNAPEESGV